MTLKEILTVINEEEALIFMPNASVTCGKERIVIEAPFTPDKEDLTVFEVYGGGYDGVTVELDFDYDYFVKNGGLD